MRKFSMFTRTLAAAVVGMFALAAVAAIDPDAARADTDNISVATPGVILLPFHLDGQFTATTADAATIKLPFEAKVIGISATARASGGTTPTLTVDVDDDDVALLASAISVTAGTVSEGTLATSTVVADESEITIDLTIGGTNPTWDDIDILLTLVRR